MFLILSHVFILCPIRQYVKETEESKIQALKASSEHDEFIAHLCHLFDIREKEEPQEFLLSKVSDLLNKHEMRFTTCVT